MVPNGWSIESLGNVTEKVGSGVTPRGGSNSYKLSGIPLIRSQNVLWGKLDLSDVAYIDELQHNKMKGSFVYKNDVLLNITGASIGRVAVSDIDEANVNQHVCIIRSEELNSEYLKSFLLSFQGQKQIEQCQAGGNRQGLNFEQIKSFKLPVPPLPEQQKIAKILSTWDKAISTTERLIENSIQQKKALMQQLLTGKKRLLDESGKRFEGEWEEYKLSEITNFIRDGTHGTHKRYESGVPMLSAKNITKQNTVDFDDAPYISEEDYNKIHARYTIKSGDILLTVVGTLGRVALVPEELAEKFTLQRSVAIIRVAKGICNQFLMQLFSSSDFTHLLHRKSNSTAQAGVYLGELGKLKILLPSFEEQQKIATVLTNADKEIELLEQQLADLQQEKKALMQVLLMGKVRVVVD
ncbi:restriction endonuclease subunit S [Psychrobacter sp. P2G3]|uniref:restriction endonuclease subunit S n=1 Tax=Psychrobacter sp. P2G3 TaxID=1699622 RepID=UPI00078E5B6C|nr:restriction endonuclease subunit S [Psychrobacter sp. P2G3]AMN50645.1 hypothetical protein AK823_12880 [Psychrobacter sp. P2G3]